jgi:hypothetical protein
MNAHIGDKLRQGARWQLALGCASVLLACSSGGSGDDDDRADQHTDGSSGSAGRSPAGHSAGSGTFDNADGMGGSTAPAASDGGARPGATCASTDIGVSLQPVHLALAFDVSGSMGKGDKPWHDKTLKWDPVVAATRAFLEDPASSGLAASLTFFPGDGDEDDRCTADSYDEPDVAMTALPSDAFGAAIAAIEPQSSDDWRGGTPTKFVMQGTRTFVEQARADDPGRYAIVLITDGYPQGCSDDDDTVDAVVTEAEGALADDVKTFVIGVANPPLDGAPDTVSDLEAIAKAGGTSPAFLIDTGKPEDTSVRLEAAIDAIRGAAIACDIAIPTPPMGQAFDKEKVAVSYRSAGSAASDLAYDPDCNAGDAFHYDDPHDPHTIVLCERTCTTVQADPDASLQVALTCERRFSVE